MSEILDRQKHFLKAAIGEARKKEYLRIKKIQNTTTKAQRDALAARFEHERQLDQNKIQQLTDELEVIKVKASNGDLKSLHEARSEIPIHLRAMDKHQANRFAGLEDYEDIVFHADVVNKLNKHDRKYERKRDYVPFDSYKEHKKLELLESKRSLLNSLVNIQIAEMRAAGQYVPPTVRTQRSALSSAASHTTYTSGRSSESWATFATNRSNTPVHNTTRSNIPRVPQLKFSAL